MNNKYDKTQILSLINKSLKALDSNFTNKGHQKMFTYDQVFAIFEELDKLFKIYYDLDLFQCCKLVINKYIPLLNLIIRLDTHIERRIKYNEFLKNSYRMGARISLEHFMIYYDWDSRDKFYENRVDILEGAVYYLNSMAYNRKIKLLVINMPSGWGKTRTVKMYEAWRLGVDPSGTYLSLARSDRLLKQGSSSVMEIIKSDQFREVFPRLDWKKDKDLFLKDSVEDWKLKHCRLGATYITGTRDGGITGLRCSYSTHIDDMYDDEYEAQSKDLNDRVYTKYQMVWTERTTKGIEPQIIVTMTKWSVDDLVSRIINDAKEKHEFKKDKFPFTEISEDGSCVIITIPALDEYDKSTCPNLNSTEYLHDKRNKISTASWLTNFQQQATPQEGLEFDWDKLETYQTTPTKEENFCKASLDPPRKGKDYLSMPIFTRTGEKWSLIDILFVQKTPKECIDDICQKIIDNNIIALVLENNTDTSLSAFIKEKLKEKGYNINLLTIYEKFNVKNKEARINDVKDTIKANIIFPCKEMYGINTQMGKAMDMLVRFSFLFPNKFDDFPDSIAMFVQEILLGGSIPQKAVAVRRIW